MPAEIVPRDACAPTLQEKLDRISKACPETKGEVLGPTLNRIMMGNVSPRSKRGQLLALLARVEAAVTPHAPCKSGCAAYCHIPLSIYEREAQTVGVLTRRTPKRLPRRTVATAVEAGKQFLN